ncbi:sigma-E processing peptidase SpoIIGA [Clostridium celatum]|uniref:sigma-E processing peptidase SpoIIGA n=1 Tax=Clostridium celatum TaxID=36834 RepID=UPI00319E09E5
MEVYLDIFIFENFIINIFLLLLTFKIQRIKYNIKLLYLSSLLGALYALVIFYNVMILTSILAKLVVAIVMIYIAIDNRKITNIIKSTFIFFMIAFMLGGMCFSFVVMQNTYLVGQDFVIENNSFKEVALALIIVFICITRIIDSIKERAIIKNFIYDIYIREGNNTLQIKGFLDTGNELREPVTNLPCILIEKNYFDQFNIQDKDKYTIRYKTISKDGAVQGFKGESIKIRNEEDKSWINVDAIICECEGKLSKTDDFHALLSRGIV